MSRGKEVDETIEFSVVSLPRQDASLSLVCVDAVQSNVWNYMTKRMVIKGMHEKTSGAGLRKKTLAS